MIYKYILLFGILFIGLSCKGPIQVDPDKSSNTFLLEGVISDSFYGYPLINVEVFIPDYNIKIYSDSSGQYSSRIKSKIKTNIIFSYINYKPFEVILSLTKDTTMNVELNRRNYDFTIIDESELPSMDDMDSTYYYYNIFNNLQNNSSLFLKHDLNYRSTQYDSIAINYYLDSLISEVVHNFPDIQFAWYKSMTSWCGPQQVRDLPYLVIKLNQYHSSLPNYGYNLTRESGIMWKGCSIGNYEFRKYLFN